MDVIGSDPRPLFALNAKKGVSFINSTTGDEIREAKGATHGHFPDLPEVKTGFIAFGAGIKRGETIHKMDLTDIAPLISYLLGIDFHTEDGILLKGIIDTND